MHAHTHAPSEPYIYRNRHAVLGRHANVMFSIALGGSGSNDFKNAADRLLASMAAEHEQGFGVLLIATRHSRVPSPEQRRRSEESTRRFAAHIRAMAMVFEGDGLWMASMRMLSRAMMLTIPARFPQSICGSVEQASAWLSGRCSEPRTELDPNALGAAVASARSST